MARAKKPIEPQAETPAAKPVTGRPTTYNLNLATVICIRIAEGESLRQILKTEGMPAQSTVYEWLLRHPPFTEQYTRAREEQADTLADEIIHIADEQPEIVVVTDKKTGAVIEHKLDNAFLLWQRNRIDARKWTAMKLKPKKYGDRMQVAGDPENPLEAKVDLGIFETILKAVELKRQTESNV
jgi:hypothetical protein